MLRKDTFIWIDDDHIFLDYISERLKYIQNKALNDGLIGPENKLTWICLNDIEAALAHLKDAAQSPHHRIGLVVLDQNMPEINGLDVAKRIKEDSDLHLYRFAMCSSDDSLELMLQSLKFGSMQFISKSNSIEHIYATLQHLMQHINQFQKAISVSRKRIRRGIASGILANNHNVNADLAFKQMNLLSQSSKAKLQLDDFCEMVIDTHNRRSELDLLLNELGAPLMHDKD